jgi:hypothetical protein
MPEVFSLSDACPDSFGAGGEGRGEEVVILSRVSGLISESFAS